MKLSLWAAPVVSVAVLFGAIGVATITGDWVTSGSEQVVQGVRLTADDIKGRMTIQAAAEGFGVTVAAIIELIDAPDPDSLAPATAFKDVEAIVPGFELSEFRERLRSLQSPAPVASATR